MRSVLLSLVVMWSAGLHAERREVDESRPAAADGVVHIKLTSGEVAVEGWDRDLVQVQGSLDRRVQEFVFERRGKDTEIKVKLPRGARAGRGSELVIRVPRTGGVEVGVISADVSVRDVDGALDIVSVSGAVDVTDIGDRVDIASVSGPVEVLNIAGQLRVKTVSGRIVGRNVGGDCSYQTVSGAMRLVDGGREIEVKSVSGDIEVHSSGILAVSGHSVSGDVGISGRVGDGGLLEYDTISGSMRLRLSSDSDARFDLSTATGGSIHNRLTQHEPSVSRRARDERLSFVMGEGNAMVVLSTGSGDITLDEL